MAMSHPLHNVQAQFAAALMTPAHDPPGVLTSHTERRPVRRFDVYRNNVMSSLSDVLAAYFPVVERLVGETYFQALAREYVRADPPRSPVLSCYGGGFASFLESFEPVADLPYLADVARLEWLQQRAYHAADRASLTVHDLVRVPPEAAADLTFELHPSLGVLSSRHPVVSIWRTNSLDEVVKPVDLGSGGQDALILRPALAVEVLQLPEGALQLIAGLAKGRNLATASRLASTSEPALQLQPVIAALIELGAFVACRHGQTRVHPRKRETSS